MPSQRAVERWMGRRIMARYRLPTRQAGRPKTKRREIFSLPQLLLHELDEARVQAECDVTGFRFSSEADLRRFADNFLFHTKVDYPSGKILQFGAGYQIKRFLGRTVEFR